jgi:hypothetical protein
LEARCSVRLRCGCVRRARRWNLQTVRDSRGERGGSASDNPKPLS